MATTVTHIVDPNSGTGFDYDSLYDWEAGEQGDLTGVRDEISVAKCRCTGGTADVTGFTIDGWTTSATQYIKIWTDTSESYRHNGTYQTGNKYRLEITDSYAVYVSVPHVRIDGLVLKLLSSTANREGVRLYRGGCFLSNSLILGPNDPDQVYIGVEIYFSAENAGTCYLWNNIISERAEGWNSASIDSNIPTGYTTYVYNCTTISGGYRGIIQTSGSLVCKNCYSYRLIDFGDAYTSGVTLTTCASSDDSGSTGLQNIALNTTNFTNVTGGAENFDLPLGSALIDVGTDTSGDGAPLNFTTDIVARTRGASWDIGAFEYVAAVSAISISISESLAFAEALD